MNVSPDSGQSQDVRELLTPLEAARLERLVRVAPFPVYGLLGRPHGLDLRSTSYCSGPLQMVTQPPESWLPDQPHVLLQVSLDFEVQSTDQHAGRTCDVVTIDSERWPDDPALREHTYGQVTYYASPDDVPPVDTTEAPGVVVERFPIVGRMVEATISLRLDKRLDPVWLFRLRSANMWVEGRAKGWTQQELLTEILSQVAVVSQRADVPAQYERELTEWRAHVERIWASIPPGTRHRQRAVPPLYRVRDTRSRES